MLLRIAADDFEHEGRFAEAVDVLLSLARIELASQEGHHARMTLTRVLTLEPARRGEAVAVPLADLCQPGLDRLEAVSGVEEVTVLESAARDPLRKFTAAALGRLYVRRGDLRAGVEWLERAFEAPPASPENGFAVLYDLAGVLDRVGEAARAHIDRIVRTEAGSLGQ
jgi:hypothetical protein